MASVTDRLRDSARALLRHSPLAVSTPTFSVALSLPIPFAMPILERRGERLALRRHPALATLQLSVCSSPARERRQAGMPFGAGAARRMSQRTTAEKSAGKGAGFRLMPGSLGLLPMPMPVRHRPRLPPGRLPQWTEAGSEADRRAPSPILPAAALERRTLGRIAARGRALLAAWQKN